MTAQHQHQHQQSMFDFEQYINQYSDLTKIKRLLFIASRSQQYGLQAARMAMQELKKGINTALYREACDTFSKQLSVSFWIIIVVCCCCFIHFVRTNEIPFRIYIYIYIRIASHRIHSNLMI